MANKSEKSKGLLNFLKTVLRNVQKYGHLVTSSAAALGVVGALFAGGVGFATIPLNQRVDALEERQELNIDHISDNAVKLSELVDQLSKTTNDLSANDYRILIQLMAQNDAGVGKQKENILFIYQQLLELCDDCPSSKIIIDEYLDSLK